MKKKIYLPIIVFIHICLHNGYANEPVLAFYQRAINNKSYLVRTLELNYRDSTYLLMDMEYASKRMNRKNMPFRAVSEQGQWY